MRNFGATTMIASILIVLAVTAGPVVAQTAPQSPSDQSQMPPDQGTSSGTASTTQLQPGEVQEQQIEQQQQVQPPGS